MKVTITDRGIRIEDAPPPDPNLGDEDGILMQQLQAMTWAVGQIVQATQEATRQHAQRSSCVVQAQQVLQRMREGLH